MRNLPRDKDITVSSNSADKYEMLKDTNNGWIGVSGDEQVSFEGENMSIERMKVDFLTRSELSDQGSFTTEEQAFLDLFTEQFVPDGYNYHGIIIPLYAYPQTWLTDTVWDKMIALINEYPDVPFKVIVNPSNGAGSSVNSDYVTLIARLKTTHAEVLGYTATNYGGTAQVDVQADLDNWVSWYDIDGFFFDETASDWTSFGTYYTTLTTYAESILTGATLVANCGVVPDTGFFTEFDIVVTWENFTYPTEPELPSGIEYYQKCILYYGTDFNESQLKENLAPNFGWVYLNTTANWADQNTYNFVRNIRLLASYDTDYIQATYHPVAQYGYGVGSSSWYGKQVDNEFFLPTAPADQSITLDGFVSVSCYTGSISCSYGTATPGSPLLFLTDGSESVAFTVSVDCTYPMVAQEQFAPPYGYPFLPANTDTLTVSDIQATFSVNISETNHVILTYGTDEVYVSLGTDEVVWSEVALKYLCQFYEDDDNYLSIVIFDDSRLKLIGKVDGTAFIDEIGELSFGDNTIQITATAVKINSVPYVYSRSIDPVSMKLGYDGSNYFNDQILEVTYNG